MSDHRGSTRRRRPFDIFHIPTYVINMKERKDRWMRFTGQAATKRLRALRKVHAFNGKKLNYLQDRRVSIRTKMNIFRNYRRSHYEIATLGAIGCSLSHIFIWKQFIKSGAPACLIFEDDAIIPEEQLMAIQDAAKTLPMDWGIWLLGHMRSNLVFAPHPQAPWRQVYSFTASHAYVLTRAAALALLEEAYPIEMHVDWYISVAAVLKHITIVDRPDIFLDYFRTKENVARTIDSNTSQFKKNGCPSCDIPDDLTQLYGKHKRVKHGSLQVDGLLFGQQPNEIRLLNGNTIKVEP